VNGERTRHFLLDRRAGWRAEPMLVDAVEWDDGPLRLRPLPGAPQAVTDASGTFGGLSDPIGVAAGGGGTIVILDRSGTRVLRYDPCSEAFAALPCLFAPGLGSGSQFALAGARDLAVTCSGDVAVADTANARVLVLVGAGLAVRAVAGPWELTGGIPCPVVRGAEVPASAACPATAAWPAGTWEPWGIAASAGGLVVTDHANGLVHFLDDCGRWQRASDGAAQGVAPLSKPTAVAVDRKGNVFVVQEGSTTVRVLDSDGVFVAELESLDERRRDFCPIAVAVGPSGELCVAGAGGELCVLAPAGETGWRSVGSTTIDAPVRGLAFDSDGNPIALDGNRCCAVRLRNAAGYPRTGRFVTTALDSGLAGCRWHRVALTASIPTGTTLRIETLAAEAPLTPAELDALPKTRWATGQVAAAVEDGRWDCLVRSAPGRYLWLAIGVASDGAATPEVDDVEVWFPRRTSAEYLPKAFRTDPESADFLERFLSIFDRQRMTVTDELDRVPALLDPMAVPAGEHGEHDFLAWLAEWVGMAVEEKLPVARRRRLVRDAAALYRLRGTPEGVRRFVSLFCGVEVRLLEHYRLRRWAIAGRGRLGDATQLFGPEIVRRLQVDEFSEIGSFRLVDTDDPFRDPFHVYAHRFSLLLLARADERRLALARRVTELAKPAHTEVTVEAVEPRLRVGTQSSIGLDSVIGEVPPPGRTGDARLGEGVVVGPDPRLGGRPLAQIGLRARVGVDTGLD